MPLLFEIEFRSPGVLGKKLEKGFTRIILSPYAFERNVSAYNCFNLFEYGLFVSTSEFVR
jgi:hypothetical protein